MAAIVHRLDTVRHLDYGDGPAGSAG